MNASKFKDMRFYLDRETRQITEDIEKAVMTSVNVDVETEHRVYDNVRDEGDTHGRE